ncbi:MAG: PASTA domain-containing protein [Clostridia bacterium]|nr:PASTA domain-containing protein [Clostridia bacterium]
MKNSFERFVGTTLDDRYQIEKLIGTGGMAVVFRAFDPVENRQVAIKMLRDEIANDKEALKRFVNESKAVALLSHPNIIKIYDIAIEGEVKYLVMEYVEGISLRTYMDTRNVLDFDEVVSYSEQILAALEHAHSKGVVHRDIKPQNIMLLQDGIVKVTDFGIAKLPDSETATISDKAIGTVYYISPEQAAGKRSDARADLYSLGVMMYEMSTGKLPFDDERPISVVMMQIHDKPVPPRQINKDIPRGLEQLILSSMEKDPKNRYQSALDMFRELRRLKRRPSAMVLTPAKLKSEKRSAKNRKDNPPSRSVTPVILGIAFAILFVGIVAVFYSLDKLNIGGIGKESIDVPNVVGKTYSSDEDLGLGSDFIITVEFEYSNTVEKNVIISQQPVGGSSRKAPCSLTIKVSGGPEQIKIEDFTLKNWREVQTNLKSNNFIVIVKEESDSAIPAGFVIRTDPGTGTSVTVGSTITIYVSSGSSQEMTSVPNFVGMSEKEAVVTLEKASLNLGDVIYTRSSLPGGTILRQTPAEGEQVYTKSTDIDFIVSGGPDFSTNYCPDVLSMTETDAVTLLNYFGLEVEKKFVANAAKAGTILTQDPTPSGDTPVPTSTTKVTLTISGGPEYTPPSITMLYVTGENITAAKKLLDWSFKHDDAAYVLTVKYVKSTEPADTVISQSPEAGPIDGSNVVKVKLVVSGGPDYIPPDVTVTVPNVVGLTLNEARASLESYGISVGKVTYAADNSPKDFIISQSLTAYTEIKGPEGEITMDIVISGGPEYVSSEATTVSTEPLADPSAVIS